LHPVDSDKGASMTVRSGIVGSFLTFIALPLLATVASQPARRRHPSPRGARHVTVRTPAAQRKGRGSR
jgi:hypothetical protein